MMQEDSYKLHLTDTKLLVHSVVVDIVRMRRVSRAREKLTNINVMKEMDRDEEIDCDGEK